ncbi:hypothetical protein RHMOL_Rhmol12G0207100 [Rhododendron molle]|uniref:Uncharacterized protein n=1 Tax=Rhododendron molle TaxID=49168 RepID=A0ACC0LLM2_RHOML|nr:hypothetical protein RHMOL_Rhmol12G0207100 [Rhododendron molle]
MHPHFWSYKHTATSVPDFGLGDHSDEVIEGWQSCEDTHSGCKSETSLHIGRRKKEETMELGNSGTYSLGIHSGFGSEDEFNRASDRRSNCLLTQPFTVSDVKMALDQMAPPVSHLLFGGDSYVEHLWCFKWVLDDYCFQSGQGTYQSSERFSPKLFLHLRHWVKVVMIWLKESVKLNLDFIQQRLPGMVPLWNGPKILEDAEVHHRRVSHLLACFRGSTITVERTPDLCRAADCTLYQRGRVLENWKFISFLNLHSCTKEVVS